MLGAGDPVEPHLLGIEALVTSSVTMYVPAMIQLSGQNQTAGSESRHRCFHSVGPWACFGLCPLSYLVFEMEIMTATCLLAAGRVT